MEDRKALWRRIAGIAALVGAGLILAGNVLDIVLDFESADRPWLWFDLCGLPLSVALVVVLLRCRDIRRVHAVLLPPVLLYLFFGGWAYYPAWICAVALVLPFFLSPKPPLPARTLEEPDRKAHWIPLLLLALLIWNYDLLLQLLGIPWTLADGRPEIFYYLHPAALILLCVPAFGGRLRDDFLALRGNRACYARRAIPKLALGCGIFVLLRFLSLRSTDLGEAAGGASDASLVTAIVAGLVLVPVAETLIFCGLTRRILPDRIHFLILGSLLFGIAHCDFTQSLPQVLLNLTALTALGYGLCVSYVETDNLFLPIGAYAYLQLLTILANLPIFQS